jgi:hypothetical protein
VKRETPLVELPPQEIKVVVENLPRLESAPDAGEGEDPRWGTYSNTHDAQDVGVSPRSRTLRGSMMVEPRAGVALNGWSPMIWAPMKWGSEGW